MAFWPSTANKVSVAAPAQVQVNQCEFRPKEIRRATLWNSVEQGWKVGNKWGTGWEQTPVEFVVLKAENRRLGLSRENLVRKQIRCWAVALLAAAVATPAVARHKPIRVHRQHIDSLYTHNFGPPLRPDRIYSYYDGPLNAWCKQSAAAYRGQDGRRHPCR